jgi:hypothetical protein
MFEGLKARMERFFADATPPADRRAQAGALRSAIIEAKSWSRCGTPSSRASADRGRAPAGRRRAPRQAGRDIGDLETWR